MRKKLNESTLLSKYFTVLLESSDIISHFGSNINPALRKAIIELHQNKIFSHEAGDITKVDKVVWGDIKGLTATKFREGIAIAIVGTNGSVVIHPNYVGNEEWWAGVMVTNDMNSFPIGDRGIKNLLKYIKPYLGKAEEFYRIFYKKPKTRTVPTGDIGDTLLKRLNPFLMKHAVKAKAELDSMIINMVKGNVNNRKINRKLRRRQDILDFLDDPKTNKDIAKRVLLNALISTINYYDPDSRITNNGSFNSTNLNTFFSKDKSGTIDKIKNNDLATIATVVYFIERAWLSI